MKTVTYALNMSQVTGGTTETTTERSSGGRRLHNMFERTVYELIQELVQYEPDAKVVNEVEINNRVVNTYDEVGSNEVIASFEGRDKYFEIKLEKDKLRQIVVIKSYFG